MRDNIEIVEPQFVLMASNPMYSDPIMHIFCSGGWARMWVQGMNNTAAQEAFCSRPKTSFFRYAPIPDQPPFMNVEFETENFNGFQVGAYASLVDFRATSMSPAQPYFSDPSTHFIAQIEVYNRLHDI